MVTVSHIVKKIVNERPVLQETIIEGIISYGALAEKIKQHRKGAWEKGKGARDSHGAPALQRRDNKKELQKDKV